MKNSAFLRNRITVLLLSLLGLNSADSQPASEPAKLVSPSWLREAVIYEIFPRNFSAEGNLKGITARLNELQDLGVTVLWLMPIHPIGERFRKGSLGSPYAIKDYYAINPDYGTEADLKRLVFEAHKRGQKVILDLVANHTAWDSVMMAHPEFYKQDASGKILPPVPEWTDVAGLNYDNPKLCDYMIKMMKYWVDPASFNIDGFRCDVAFMVPTRFWEQARKALVEIKPDVMLLAEASKPELLHQAFDIDYAWPFHGTLNDVLLNGAPASRFRQSWTESRQQFPAQALHLRISDNHDEARAIARFGLKGALAASALMFTLDGVPLLYNGMEVGDATESGDPALFEKLPIFWSPKERQNLRAIYRDLIKLRRQHPAFQNDHVNWILNSEESSVVSFSRSDGKEEFVVAINFCNRPLKAKVEVTKAGEFIPFRISGSSDCPAGDFPLMNLKGFEWRIYQRAPRP